MRSYILLGKAWAAKEAADDATVMVYTGKIIEVYTPQAISMQKSLTEPLPPADKEKVFSMWALNDVGTAYFLKGQSLEKMGKPKEAVEAYKFLTENLPFAQCWDTKGWFWKPASAAAERIQALQFDAVK
jgi:tetratricopeptide (TPR) repeat protein